MRETQTVTSAILNSDRDRYLVVAIHQIMEEYGWKTIGNHFDAGFHFHNMIFVNPKSLLERIDLKTRMIRGHLDVSSFGATNNKGILNKFFDLDVRKIPKTFNLCKQVSDETAIINELLLRNAVGIGTKELEDSANK
jgi:hypothetical protein